MSKAGAGEHHDTWVPVPMARWHAGALEHTVDGVANEVPVAMVYNGVSHAVMLATPQDLECFGLGFSLTEGIVVDASEMYDMEVVPRSEGIELQMTIAQQRFALLGEKRRSMAGRTGCGLCGAESLLHVVRHPPAVTATCRVTTSGLHAAARNLEQQQPLQAKTGAVHAAAWVAASGEIVAVREDVGRHNALDKLIGTLARDNIGPEGGFALVSSRASYEMVQKSAAYGIALLAAVSAPTALAVRLAEETGVTLVGFVRQDSHVVYAHPDRILH